MKESSELPYKTLGLRLKDQREKRQESVDEVAGAVEIDSDVLSRIELGQERPSEDILMLLINHFSMHEDEASKLWLLAGYDKPQIIEQDVPGETPNRPVVMMMTLDSRILYSDSAQVNANQSGVILSFAQPAPQDGQHMPIARIGMSYEQADSLLKVLHQTLVQANALRQPKALPPPNQAQNKQKKSDSN